MGMFDGRGVEEVGGGREARKYTLTCCAQLRVIVGDDVDAEED